MERRARGLARRTFTLPWLTVPAVGIAELSKLVGKPLVGW
jgi:arsenite-transporting ATPase